MCCRVFCFLWVPFAFGPCCWGACAAALAAGAARTTSFYLSAACLSWFGNRVVFASKCRDDGVVVWVGMVTLFLFCWRNAGVGYWTLAMQPCSVL